MANREAEPTNSKMQALIVLAAMVVAAAPHAFFAPPLQLHMEGALDGFYGISSWAPAILGGLAFFFGVEFGAKRADAGLSVAARGTLLAVLLVVLAIVTAEVFESKWVQMAGLRPWEELRVALPMYAGLFALQSLFWQGFVQHRAAAPLSPALRVVVATLLPALLYLPFLLHGTTDAVLALTAVAALSHLAAALLYEAGFAVRACMAASALYGLMFIWFQQAMFL